MGKKPNDISNTKFGNLMVLDYVPYKKGNSDKKSYWNTVCDCGTKKQYSYTAIDHKIRSNKKHPERLIDCGCSNKKQREGSRAIKGGLRKIPAGEANFNYKFLAYRVRAKQRGINFELTKEQFREIIVKNCNYCNAPPSMSHIRRSQNGAFISNGIDRKDNKIGYVYSNCVPCCKHCNIIKRDLTEEEFISHIKKILQHTEAKAVKFGVNSIFFQEVCN